MLANVLVVTAIIIGIIFWISSVKRKLVVLNDNVRNAMNQIGIQLASHLDSLTALLYVTRNYAKHESETLLDEINAKRCIINASSTPDEVLLQESIITKALGIICTLSKQHNDLKTNESFNNLINAVQAYENMLKTSRLIYDDSVAKLNRELRVVPVCIIAMPLGFSKKQLLIDRKNEKRN